jgi:hypothetical protein
MTSYRPGGWTRPVTNPKGHNDVTASAAVRGVATGVGILLATTAALFTSTAPAYAATCRTGVAGDVNGDGHAEVVVGSDYSRTGGVHVFYGKSSGLVADKSGAALDDQYFSQATAGVPGTTRPYDGFGAATALGDLNGDGCADLAIGAPGAALAGDYRWNGTVTILYGSKSGLTTRGAQRFTSEQVLGGSEADFHGFGGTMALADFDDDGVADLAVGAPGRALTSRSVAVLFGASTGLSRGRATEIVSRPASGTGEMFGSGDLAIGDFDGNDRVELAIGDREAVTTVERAAGGFAASTPRVLTKGSLNVPDADDTDGFGSVLAAGDVNADGTSDLAIGVPQFGCDEEEPDVCGPGAVLLVPGSPSGLEAAQRQAWTQDSAGMGGTARVGDGFGAALVMGRFDAGATSDLAIGTPRDSVGSVQQAGSVSLLLGGASGLTTAGAGGSRFHQDRAGFTSAPRGGEEFGGVLAAAPIQSAAQDNLLIGVRFETVGKRYGAGLVHQLARSAAGPSSAGGVTLHLDRPGVKGKATENGWFGWSLG